MWHNCFIVDFILYSYTQGKTLKQTWQERLRKHLTSSKMLSSLISLLYFYSKKEIEQNSIKMLLWSFTCFIYKQTNTFFYKVMTLFCILKGAPVTQVTLTQCTKMIKLFSQFPFLVSDTFHFLLLILYSFHCTLNIVIPIPTGIIKKNLNLQQNNSNNAQDAGLYLDVPDGNKKLTKWLKV